MKGTLKNKEYDVEITGLTTQGYGVGRADGVAVFVPGAAVGDTARIKIVSEKKQYCYGKLLEVLHPSPDRIPADCPYFARCGGCSLRHIRYEAELELKQRQVTDALQRIGGLSVPVRPILPSPLQERYRHKAQLPCARKPDGSVGFGFYAPRSHRVVFFEDCLLQPENFSSIMHDVADFLTRYRIPPYDETTREGLVRHLYLRRSKKTGDVMVCLVLNGTRLPKEAELCSMLTARHPEIVSVLINVNTRRGNVILGSRCRVLYGQNSLTDSLLGVDFQISPLAFFQVNPAGAERLYEAAAQAAQPDGKHILDLYCGTGSIGLTMAGRAKQLTGVEVIPEAVDNAAENARRAGIQNARFLCADAGQAARQLSEEGLRPDVVIVDPPRAGCSAAALSAIRDMSPERVVMVSCNPATMARDIQSLAAYGFVPQYVQPVDMFPRTTHVEAACLLTRTEAPDGQPDTMR